MSEAEWSQHKKLIDFASRPGGFRRMMVPNLPYFMVQFDYKGEKGYGHVIEGSGETMGDEEGLDEGEKGGGDFPRWVIPPIRNATRHANVAQILCWGNHRKRTGAGSKTMATTSTRGFRQEQREGGEIQERLRSVRLDWVDRTQLMGRVGVMGTTVNMLRLNVNQHSSACILSLGR